MPDAIPQSLRGVQAGYQQWGVLMLTVDSVSFDTTGLHIHADGTNHRLWSTEAGHQVAVDVEPGSSPVLALARDPQGSRKFGEWIAGTGRALIEFTPIRGDGWVLVRMLVKSAVDPPNERSRSYSGSLTIPFRDGSLLFRTAAYEHGLSGVRESEVFAHLMATGALREPPGPGHGSPDGTIWHGRHESGGWLSDPDDPAPPHLARCVADDPAYDAWFPDHPLTRIRLLLDQIQRSVRVSPDEAPVTSFTVEPPRRWWNRWRVGPGR